MLNKLVFIFALLAGSIEVHAEVEEGLAACPTIAMTGSDVDCYGQSNGTAQVAITNGSGNYTITWSNTANGNSISGLSVGTYTVNVKDNVSGCTVVGAFVVGSPDPISFSDNITDVDCFGNNSGSIAITTYGGTLPYSYSWTNGTTNEDLTNVTADDYTLSVVDGNGCTFSQIYTIQEPLEPISSSAVVSDADCFATSTGDINLEVWGGTPVYSYLWSSGQSTQDITNVPSGNYTVTVSDANGCSTVFPFIINQPNALGGSVSSTDVLCYGDDTGTAFFSPTGGVSPYSYSWQNSTTLYSTTNATITGIPADTYQVTVTDDRGCVYVDNVDVLSPAELVITDSHINVSCYGGADGSIDISPVGGVLPYTYNWTNSTGAAVSTNQDPTNLVAEIYTVVVTDDNGCTSIHEREVYQPNLPISVTEEVTHVLCFGDNTGEIDLSVLGGTIPYTYSWTTSQITEDISNLLASTYGYTVTDANGCQFTNSVVVNEPLAPIQVTTVVTDVNCFGESNGDVDLTVTGGTLPYAYAWTNSTYSLSYTAEDLLDFVADLYHFEITDDHGCIYIDSVEIAEPLELQTSYTKIDVLCYGENTGEIDLEVVGGVSPYVYNWSNAATTQDLTGLVSGSYLVAVLDDHNCLVEDSIFISQPNDTISFTAHVNPVSCNGGSNGAIDLFVAGGTLPYSYSWSNGDDSTTIVNLTSSYYTFDVLDGNGCLFTDSIYMPEPNPLTLNEVITPVSCKGGDDGEINITPQGGTAPYSYTWLNSEFTLSAQDEDLIGFIADIYQLEVVDSNGCFYEVFMEIAEPDSLRIDYTVKPVSCYGGSDGAIDCHLTGGNPGYFSVWSSGELTEDIVDVMADIYTVYVTDTKGCLDSASIEVTQPDSLIVNFDHDPVSCIDQFDGVAYAHPEGGNGGYMYDWSNGATTSVNTGLISDWYTLTVTDLLGCTVYDSVFVTSNDGPCLTPVSAFSPNMDNYNDTWVIDNMYLYPQLEMKVFNKWGNVVHKQSGEYEPWDGSINGVQAPSETYYYIIHLNYEDRESVRGNITIIR